MTVTAVVWAQTGVCLGHCSAGVCFRGDITAGGRQGWLKGRGGDGNSRSRSRAQGFQAFCWDFSLSLRNLQNAGCSVARDVVDIGAVGAGPASHPVTRNSRKGSHSFVHRPAPAPLSGTLEPITPRAVCSFCPAGRSPALLECWLWPLGSRVTLMDHDKTQQAVSGKDVENHESSSCRRGEGRWTQSSPT